MGDVINYFEQKAAVKLFRHNAEIEATAAAMIPRADPHAVDFSKCPLALAYPRAERQVSLRGAVFDAL